MKISEKIMGMDARIEILDCSDPQIIDELLEYFHIIENTFSIYKKSSDIAKINRRLLQIANSSPVTRKVLKLAEDTKLLTHGFFDITIDNHIDPSGLLKGYCITEASKKLLQKEYPNFYIEIGGDMQIHGYKNNKKWKVGLQNPVLKERTYVLNISNKGISTSGLNETGLPVYNPITKKIASKFASVTLIADSCFDADRFSTACFAMGEKAINFLEKMPEIDAFIVFRDGKEFMTKGFRSYL